MLYVFLFQTAVGYLDHTYLIRGDHQSAELGDDAESSLLGDCSRQGSQRNEMKRIFLRTYPLKHFHAIIKDVPFVFTMHKKRYLVSAR